MSELTYKGGSAIPGIPARDLSAEEVEKYGGKDFLLKTGLWFETAPKTITKRKSEKDGK